MSDDILYHLIAIIYLSALTLYVYLKSNKRLNITLYIVVLYLLSVFGGLFLDSSLTPNSSSYSLNATFLFLMLLSLFLVPLIVTKTEDIQIVKCPNYSMFDVLCYIFMFIGLASYLYFPFIIYDLLLVLSEAKYFRGYDTGLSDDSIYLFITLGCQFYPVVLLFYFHSIAYRPHKIWFNRALLISSTAYIINVLTVMGRDGFVLWTMSYIFAYILYKNQLPNQLKIKLKRGFLVFISIFIFIFSIISISRFYNNNDSYMFFQKLLLYFSQQFGEFNRYVTLVKNQESDLGSVFPIIDLFVEKRERYSFLDSHYMFLSQYGFSKNVFKTYLGEFYQELGIVVTLVVSVLFSVIFSFLFRSIRSSNLKLGQLILLTLYSQIILHGIFYYKLSYTVSNIYMIFCLLLSLLFTYKLKNSN